MAALRLNAALGNIEPSPPGIREPEALHPTVVADAADLPVRLGTRTETTTAESNGKASSGATTAAAAATAVAAAEAETEAKAAVATAITAARQQLRQTQLQQHNKTRHLHKLQPVRAEHHRLHVAHPHIGIAWGRSIPPWAIDQLWRRSARIGGPARQKSSLHMKIAPPLHFG